MSRQGVDNKKKSKPNTKTREYVGDLSPNAMLVAVAGLSSIVPPHIMHASFTREREREAPYLETEETDSCDVKRRALITRAP